MALADVAVDLSEPFVQEFSKDSMPEVESRFGDLRARALEQLQAQGVSDTVSYDCYLSLQYQGSDTTLMILRPEDDDFVKTFVQEHKREFAFALEAPIMIAGVRVRATAKSVADDHANKSPYLEELKQLEASTQVVPPPRPFTTNSTYFEDIGAYSDIPLYRLQDLVPGVKVSGPAIILDNTQTVVLHPQNTATILKSHILYVVCLSV
jgi:5-oxoprolinase (ATP-hydrolysing)